MDPEIISSNLYKSLNIFPFSGPKFEYMSSFQARKETFIKRNWNHNLPIKYIDLVEAGFYYTGINDKVICYYCDGGLENWGIGDEPWIEHAKFYNDCGYLRFKKSEAFIKCCNYSNHFEDFNIYNKVLINNINLSKILEDWMKQDIVVQLLNLNVFSIDVIKRTLYNRFKSCEKQFLLFEDLYKAANETTEEAKNNLSIMSKFLSVSLNAHGETKVPYCEVLDSSKSQSDKLLCKICFTREISVVILPCDHQLTCIECLPKLKICPICRKVIEAYIKTYIS